VIQELIAYVNTLSGGNQFIGGVIMTFLSGGVLFLLRDVPLRLWQLGRLQLVTSVVIDTTTWNKRHLYIQLLDYIGKRSTEFGTRSLSYDVSLGYEDMNSFVSIGFGHHLFFYGKVPLLALRRRIEQQGMDANEFIVLYKFGRKHDIFHKLLSEITPKNRNKLHIYQWGKESWERSGEIDRGEGLDSIALDADIRALFVKEFMNFRDKRDVHKRLGIAHKLSYVLHGLPGSGKTSLIRALAAEFNFNICLLDASSMDDKKLMQAFTSVPKQTIVLAEDFDSAKQLHSRAKASNKMEIDYQPGTLKGMLNALEGIQALDNVVVIFTTNHLDKIDPAMIRPGRIDHIRQLPAPGIDAVKQHFLKHYPELATMPTTWGHIPGCIIHSIKQRALDDANIACELINYYVRNQDVALKEQLGRIEEMEAARQYQRMLTTREPVPDGDAAPVAK